MEQNRRVTGEYDLERFIEAQASIYGSALAELRAGRKSSHWMWFIFPQIAGLAHSPTSEFYAIESLAEAQAYLLHPLLGSRLVECTDAVLLHPDKSARHIFGSPDDVKFRSSMTLFEAADPNRNSFTKALGIFFAGEPDRRTLTLLAQKPTH